MNDESNWLKADKWLLKEEVYEVSYHEVDEGEENKSSHNEDRPKIKKISTKVWSVKSVIKSTNANENDSN